MRTAPRSAAVRGRFVDGRRQSRLQNVSQARFEKWADLLPISVWEEDFSAIRRRFDELRRIGVIDIPAWLESHPDEVLSLAAKVKILGVNRKSVEILGASSREQLLRDLATFMTPEALLVFRDEFGALARGETTFEAENPLRDARGVRRTMAMHLAVADGHEHDLSRVFVSFVDITSLKATEQAMAEREASLRLSQQLAKIGHWTRDELTGEETWSDELYRILGLEPREAGRDLIATFAGLVHPDDREIVERETAIAVWKPPYRRYPRDFRIVRPDGELRVLSAVPGLDVTDAKGAILRSTGVLQDVTERRRVEEELRRTQKLESLALLAGGIAHDFNNFLTAMFANIEIAIQEAGLGSRVARTLEDAMAAFHRARDLTGQLLTFSRGGAPVTKALEVDEAIAAACRLSLSGSGVGSRVEIERGVPPVNADPGQLNQVLSNLLLNARQAMAGHGTITVTARGRHVESGELGELGSGLYVEIAVADEGVGMSAEQLARVFDPFYTTKPHGTGLGLTTCYSIVRRHGGLIAVDSTPGRGTTVTILIPSAAGPADAGEVASPRPPAPRPARKKILVMDDDPLIAPAAKRLLGALGYAAETAPDGARAVAMFEEARNSGAPYDLVILDLTVVAGMGGSEAIAMLRSIDPSVRAIVSSGYSDGAVFSNPSQFGFDGVLAKPYRLEDVALVVASVLRER